MIVFVYKKEVFFLGIGDFFNKFGSKKAQNSPMDIPPRVDDSDLPPLPPDADFNSPRPIVFSQSNSNTMPQPQEDKSGSLNYPQPGQNRNNQSMMQQAYEEKFPRQTEEYHVPMPAKELHDDSMYDFKFPELEKFSSVNTDVSRMQEPEKYTPKPVEIQNAGPIYVDINNYKEILDEIDQVEIKLKKIDDVFARLNEIKNNKDKTFEKWNFIIEDIQRQCVYVEKTIYEDE